MTAENGLSKRTVMPMARTWRTYPSNASTLVNLLMLWPSRSSTVRPGTNMPGGHWMSQKRTGVRGWSIM